MLYLQYNDFKEGGIRMIIMFIITIFIIILLYCWLNTSLKDIKEQLNKIEEIIENNE